MENEQASLTETERLRGITSLLNVSEARCDKCDKLIRYLERYCYNINECPICGNKSENLSELDIHFSQQHPGEPVRGTRYCGNCSSKAGYIKLIRNKKTGDMLSTMFVLRDEELVDNKESPE